MKAFPTNATKFTETNGEELVLQGQEGMDLRDFFAAKAMHAIINGLLPERSPYPEMGTVARDAYKIANDMMKEREKL